MNPVAKVIIHDEKTKTVLHMLAAVEPYVVCKDASGVTYGWRFEYKQPLFHREESEVNTNE